MVTGDVISGSTWIGILIIAYSLTDDNRIIYETAEHSNVQHRQTYTITTGLPAGQYEVVIFVVENDGRPLCRAAATPKTVQTDGK